MTENSNFTVLYGGRTGDTSDILSLGINVLELSLLNSTVFKSSILTLNSALSIPFKFWNFYNNYTTTNSTSDNISGSSGNKLKTLGKIWNVANLILLNGDPLLNFGELINRANRYWQNGVEVNCNDPTKCPQCLEEATVYYELADPNVEKILEIVLPIFFFCVPFTIIVLAIIYHVAFRRRKRKGDIDDPFAEDVVGEEGDEENLMDQEEESDEGEEEEEEK